MFQCSFCASKCVCFFYCIACVVSVSAKVTLLESAAFGQCIFSSWSGPLALKSSGDFRRGEEVRPFFTYVFNMVPGIRVAIWGLGGSLNTKW